MVNVRLLMLVAGKNKTALFPFRNPRSFPVLISSAIWNISYISSFGKSVSLVKFFMGLLHQQVMKYYSKNNTKKHPGCPFPAVHHSKTVEKVRKSTFKI